MNFIPRFLNIPLTKEEKRRMQSEAANRAGQDKSCLNTFEGNEHSLASYDCVHYVSIISNVKHYLNVREKENRNITNYITKKLMINAK